MAEAAYNRETVFDLRGELLTFDYVAVRLATPPVPDPALQRPQRNVRRTAALKARIHRRHD